MKKRNLLFFVFLFSCTNSSLKNQYLFAEKLWKDQKYGAAVSEFEKITRKDALGKIGLRALYQGAMIQALYLFQYPDAVQKLKIFSEKTDQVQDAWEAQKLIGEIFFSQLENYEKASQHYETLLKNNPNVKEGPEFLFRIAKSHFFLSQFDEALKIYEDLIQHYSETEWGQKALFESAATSCIRAGKPTEQGQNQLYQAGIDRYEKFLSLYPKSKWAIQAKFGIANCLEEMDKLDVAESHYQEIRTSYPSPKIIDLKLRRIAERKMQRGNH